MARILGAESTGGPPETTAQIVAEHLSTGGKRLRARLALAACRALKVEAAADPARDAAIAWAAACELLHNATLIHDDIQDGDQLRRGKPTMWVKYDLAHALNAGDLALILPSSAITRDDIGLAAATQVALCRGLCRYGATVIRGQTAELALHRDDAPSWASYCAAVGAKTSALFELPVLGAGHIATPQRDTPPPAQIAAAFADLGLLFQLQDDVLDLFGNKGRGSSGSDIAEGKISALVVHHMQLHPGDTKWLLDILRSPRANTSPENVEAVRQRFADGGALQQVVDEIVQMAAALHHGQELAAVPRLAQLRSELVDTVLEPIQHLLL